MPASPVAQRVAHNERMLSRGMMFGTPRLAAVLALLLATGAVGCGIADRLTGEKDAKQIRAIGVPAEATIVQIWDTGVTVNENPVVGFLLDVHPENQAAFQAKTKALVSRLAVPRVQPGARLRVFFDPKDTTRVAVDRIP